MSVRHSGEPVESAERLAALRRTGLLDSPAEESFDRLGRVAAAAVEAPVALVSLVDEDRQFFKACIGLGEPWNEVRETPLSHSFCRHAVEAGEPLVISDAREHPLVSDNPAIDELDVIAYCGIPLESPDGHLLGTLCVIDREPRQWTGDEVALMEDVAASVCTEIDLRAEVEEHQRDLRAMAQGRRRLERVLETTIDGIVLLNAEGIITYANDAAESILNLKASEIEGKSYQAPDWEVRAVTGDPMPGEEQPVGRVLSSGEPVRGQEIEVRVGDDGDWRVLSVNAAPVTAPDGEVAEVVATFRDVTQKRRAEEALRHRALHDPLTGLANRALFFDRLEHALARSEREEAACSVLFVDLDGFKSVNDRYGHATGDRVLTAIARRLQGCLREPDTVARIGGDEFTVLLEGPGGPEEVRNVVPRILDAVGRAVEIDGDGDVRLGASVGVAWCDRGGTELGDTLEARADELVRRADQAMYGAKERGGDGEADRSACAFYGEED